MTSPAPTAADTGARQGTLRERNLGLVARTVCAAGSASRADVATATGMTRATVSRLADELVAGGVLAELGTTAGTGRGRPPTPLVPSTNVVALGLQVNASYLAVRAIGLDGESLGERVELGDFVMSDPAEVLPRLASMIRSVKRALPTSARLVGTGLALPGIIRTEDGLLLRAPNLGWTDVRPAPLLRRAVGTGAALRIGNEADLAARATAELAPGRRGDWSDFIYLSGEIGIGGSIVLGGRPLDGSHGWAGEIGHVCVDPTGPACRCGSTGCLEQYAGRLAVLHAARLPDDATTDDLLAAAARSERHALDAIDRAAWALGVALGSVVNLLDLQTVVLGGHLAQLLDALHPRLLDELGRRSLSADWVTPTVVRPPVPDNAPGATGAAYAVLAEVVTDPARFLV